MGRQIGFWVLMEPLSQQTPQHTCCLSAAGCCRAGPASQQHLLSLSPVSPGGWSRDSCVVPTATHPARQTPRSCLHPLSAGRAKGWILIYCVLFNSKFSGKRYFGRSDMVCEVWLHSVNSLILQKMTAVFLILLPFLINCLLQNTIFLVKIDSHWPNSPQMRHGTCFELTRSIAAGQQQHFSCFFGLLKTWRFGALL